MKRRALVSIGTNSTRLLILDGRATVAVESRGTRLGTGLRETGRLDPVARGRTLDAVHEYMEIVRANDARVAAIATSAMRRAADGDDFAHDVAEAVGVPLRILSGDEEATFSYLGATSDVDGDELVAVLDVGGGSSELAVDVPAGARERGTVEFTVSVEIGAVRLAEQFPDFLGAKALDPPARADLIAQATAVVAAIQTPFEEAPFPERLIAVGGTAFTAAAMIAKAQLRHGVTIGEPQRRRLLDDLLARPLDARRAMPFIRPQRADILPAGIVIIDEACRRLGIETVEVSVEDLLAGYLASDEYERTAV